MNITDFQKRQSLISWAERIASLLDQGGDKAAASDIRTAAEQFRSQRFMIAVLGKAKRGKSTLINVLLGRKDDTVAPIDKLPVSSAITRFAWAETDAATVLFQDGRRETIPFNRIRDFVTEERNKENLKGVDLVEVAGPFAGLDKDLVLVDTPGAGSIHEHHDALLHAFIPQADSVIFLVTARMPLDQDELELLKQVKSADVGKIFFAVNRVDESDERDIEDAIIHNREQLAQAGVSVEHVHRISAKRAFQGDVATSGMAPLCQEIQRYLAENKARVLTQHFVRRVNQLAEPALQSLELELSGLNRTDQEIESQIAKLRADRQGVQQDRDLTEREFVLAWSRAVDSFEHEVRQAERKVSTAIAERIKQSGLSQVGQLARELPARINREIDACLDPHRIRFEQSLQSAVTKLEADYPSLDLGDFGGVTIRAREGGTLLKGTLGGLAAAATGVGLATAGTAAAAGIAAANAAALAATTTITVPSVVAGLGSLVPGWLGGMITAAATGTATVAAPAAITTAPLWVALSGPIGWTLAGVGVLAVPLAWRISKVRLKDKLDEACAEQIRQIFKHIRAERLPVIRKMAQAIVQEFGLRLERRITQIEAALQRVQYTRANPAKARESEQASAALRAAMDVPADGTVWQRPGAAITA